MEQYENQISKAIKAGFISTSDVFYYKETDLDFYFNWIFESYSISKTQFIEYGIEPCYIVFSMSNLINASAKKINENYGIEFSMMLVKFLQVISLHIDNEFEVKYSDTVYKNLENKLDSSIGWLTFQSAMNFIFYHEICHLIQFKTNNVANLNESNSLLFDYKNHIYETDADLFGSVCVSTLFYQYFTDLPKEDLTQENLETFLTLILSSIFVSILCFNNFKVPFYLKKYSHPHAIIRLNGIIPAIIDYFKKLLAKKEINLSINAKDLIIKTLDFVTNFSKKSPLEPIVENFHFIYNKNEIEITKYSKELLIEVVKYQSSGINARNNIIKQNRK